VYRFLGVGLTLEGRGLPNLGAGRAVKGLLPENRFVLFVGETERGKPDIEEVGVSKPEGRPGKEMAFGNPAVEDTDEGGECVGEK